MYATGIFSIMSINHVNGSLIVNKFILTKPNKKNKRAFILGDPTNTQDSNFDFMIELKWLTLCNLL